MTIHFHYHYQEQDFGIKFNQRISNRTNQSFNVYRHTFVIKQRTTKTFIISLKVTLVNKQ